MKNNVCCNHPGGGAVYGLGFLGALIYFFQHASSLQEGVIGFFKAMLWPAFLLYRVLEMVKL